MDKCIPVGDANDKKLYTMSQTAIDQRAKNGQRKRWSANLKALNERLSLKVDEFKLMNEIMGYIEQTFSFEQLSEIFQHEFEELIENKMNGIRQQCDEKVKEAGIIHEKETKLLEEAFAEERRKLHLIKNPPKVTKYLGVTQEKYDGLQMEYTKLKKSYGKLHHKMLTDGFSDNVSVRSSVMRAR